MDVDASERIVSPRTRLIVICNPEQPDRRAVRGGRSRSRRGASPRATAPGSLADEIYRGAELDGRETATMWGRYDRVIVTERPVEGVRAAGPAHRLGRRAADDRRGAVVVPRLHDDRARRAERRAGAARARTGAPDRDPRAHARHPRIRTFPIIARWLDAARRPLQLRAAGRRRDRLRALSPRASTRPSSSPACGRKRACSSCPAITSAWTAICASDSGRANRPPLRCRTRSCGCGASARSRHAECGTLQLTFDLILVGFGNVARRFVTLLAEQRAALARDLRSDDARGRHRHAARSRVCRRRSAHRRSGFSRTYAPASGRTA